MPLAESGLATEKTAMGSGVMDIRKYLSWSESIAMYKVGSDALKAWEKRNQQKIKSSPPTAPHIASPEVIIDEQNQKIRLYCHGVVEGSLQMSKVALSNDGIHFEALEGLVGLPYMRIFPFREQYYGLAMPGFFYRSKDGLSDFEVRKRWLFDLNIRHSALYRKENDLYIFYSKVGDSPERILCSHVDISSENRNNWKASPSSRGEMGVMIHHRDPAIFEDEDGQVYLLYTGVGEQGIGIVELKINNEELITKNTNNDKLQK